LDKPFTAYQGTEPFMFVCYAHSDSEIVYTDLKQIHDAGINLWYDEGIQAGSSWRAEIATAIKGATKLIFFISEASLKSSHCLREIDYALGHDIEIVPVYLDDVSLPGELELVLNRVQALFRKTDSLYMQHLLSALQNSTALAPIGRALKKRKKNIVFVLLILVLGLVILFKWSPWEASLVKEHLTSSPVSAPNAYDRYLAGLDLMERWDKDDNLDTAIGLFREASTLDSSFALAYARLADALRMRYSLTRDENWLDEATENANEAVRLNADLAPVQVALGRIYFVKGNLDLAIASLERAVSIDPNDAIANQVIASIYERLGRIEDAEASFQKALSLDPERISIHDAYAHFLFRQSRFDEAALQWRAVIRLAPDHFAALVNLGSTLNEAGKTAEAITVYQRAIELRPTYMAYSNLGTAYSRGEQYADAVNAYQKAIEIEDTDWLAWGNLAYVYSWMTPKDPRVNETFQHAIELAEAARQENLRDPFVHSDLALYYAKTDQPGLALERLGTAITLSPDSGEIHAAAAEVYEILGQRDKAIEFAQKSLELGYTRQQFRRNPEMSELLLDPRMQTPH